jgi:Arc/MetJ family transcription regulator
MRTTLALDDELLAKPQAFTGLKQKSSLVREALKALIERESARRLARLGGSEPEMDSLPRRRPSCASSSPDAHRHPPPRTKC